MSNQGFPPETDRQAYLTQRQLGFLDTLSKSAVAAIEVEKAGFSGLLGRCSGLLEAASSSQPGMSRKG